MQQSTVEPNKRHEESLKLTAEFLAAGGKIIKCKAGVSSLTKNSINNKSGEK